MHHVLTDEIRYYRVCDHPVDWRCAVGKKAYRDRFGMREIQGTCLVDDTHVVRVREEARAKKSGNAARW